MGTLESSLVTIPVRVKLRQGVEVENEIITFLCQRDKRGISLLYEKYSPAMYGMVCRMIPHAEIAEEVLQDVFVKVWENADKYDSNKGSLFTWLTQITRNTSLDKLRSTGYRQQSKTYLFENADEIGNFLVETTTIQDSGLRKVVDGLGNTHRMLIDCAYFQGYSQAEIAEEFSMPLGTVKTRIRAAIKELRRLLHNDIAA